MTPPVFYLLAGPNGAGKSTMCRAAERRPFVRQRDRFLPPLKLQLMAYAQAAGFRTVLLVVCVDDAQQLVRRVAQRVREGGHAVPPDRILARHPRTLAHLRGAVRLADLALLYDTSGTSIQPPRLVARCRRGLPPVVPGTLPVWAASVLAC